MGLWVVPTDPTLKHFRSILTHLLRSGLRYVNTRFRLFLGHVVFRTSWYGVRDAMLSVLNFCYNRQANVSTCSSILIKQMSVTFACPAAKPEDRGLCTYLQFQNQLIALYCKWGRRDRSKKLGSSLYNFKFSVPFSMNQHQSGFSIVVIIFYFHKFCVRAEDLVPKPLFSEAKGNTRHNVS